MSQTQNPTSGVSQVEVARKKILEVDKMLNSIIIGHEDMIKALLIAVVAREHMVVIGPPGTAKSYTIHTLAKLLNAKFYNYLLTRFTSYDELFGSVDVVSLTKGEFRRNWSRLISSEFVFLDEIFKANSAILNALLSLLQERIVYDAISGQPIQSNLWSCVGASNEPPEDPELSALYDRFSVRVFIDYLNDDAILLRAIEQKWTNNNSLSAIASMNDVKVLHDYAVAILRSKIKDLGDVLKVFHVNMIPLIKSMRSKGVLVSDRTLIEKLPKLYGAYLAVYGVTMDNVMNAGYDLVMWLARNRSELNDIKKVIDDSLGEIAELSRKLEKAKESIRAMDLKNAKNMLNDVLSYDVNRLTKTPWLKPRAEAIISTAREYLNKIISMEETLKKLGGEL